MTTKYTIAAQVVCDCQGAAAFTLECGYAVDYDCKRTTFPVAHTITRKIDKNQRVTKYVGEYTDGSRVTYWRKGDYWTLVAS